jgi:hypothetical protein
MTPYQGCARFTRNPAALPAHLRRAGIQAVYWLLLRRPQQLDRIAINLPPVCLPPGPDSSDSGAGPFFSASAGQEVGDLKNAVPSTGP